MKERGVIIWAKIVLALVVIYYIAMIFFVFLFFKSSPSTVKIISLIIFLAILYGVFYPTYWLAFKRNSLPPQKSFKRN